MRTLKEELIGLFITIQDAKNKSLIGIRGKVIDETQHTLTIRADGENKKVIKDQVTLTIPEKGVKVKGSLLKARPEDRIKKKTR
jgi:ribonuclease P protein subunit POP4